MEMSFFLQISSMRNPLSTIIPSGGGHFFNEIACSNIALSEDLPP